MRGRTTARPLRRSAYGIPLNRAYPASETTPLTSRPYGDLQDHDRFLPVRLIGRDRLSYALGSPPGNSRGVPRDFGEHRIIPTPWASPLGR
jgi:hypothetical protein